MSIGGIGGDAREEGRRRVLRRQASERRAAFSFGGMHGDDRDAVQSWASKS